MLLININPSFASFLMILFHEVSDKFKKNALVISHPPPFSRIDSLFKETELHYIASNKLYELNSTKKFYSLVKKIYYDRAYINKTHIDENHIEKMAKGGDLYYQQMASSLYINKYNIEGPSASLCEKLIRSFIVRINNKEAYSYFDRIYSMHSLGWTLLITDGCPHDELAGCEQMRTAADQGYIFSIEELKLLRDKKRPD